MMQARTDNRPWYFTPFESRQPAPPGALTPWQLFLAQMLGTASIALGVWYLAWRWSESLNWQAPGFAITLAVAETLAFIGSVLFTGNLWLLRDTPVRRPPSRLSDIAPATAEDRPVIVDVFFPTYNEDVELVRLSIVDAKRMRIPQGVEMRIHVLDDGNRPEMRRIAEAEGVNYLARKANIGYKAGNIRNGMAHTEGDLMVIFDADTRPFPAFLERTLGYFRDPDVAWVQTPQWFFDYREGIPLPDWLSMRLGSKKIGSALGRAIERVIGPIHIGRDILGNDPDMFYDIILRRRNWCNASFCCGAGSIHRREAIMRQALRRHVQSALDRARDLARHVPQPELRKRFMDQVMLESARRTEIMPYLFHVSEDIYTGIHLHADESKNWKSIYHPEKLSKMLSPQDLQSWSVQRFKYAGGTLDILVNDNPLKMKGLSFWQKWMYGATFYSYLSPLWIVPFLFAPIFFFFTGTAPISAYDGAFYMHLLPFLIISRLHLMVATWGTPTIRGEQYYLAFFWHNIKAMWEVLCKQPIKFHVTPKHGEHGIRLDLVWPQMLVIVLSIAGACYMGWRVHAGLEQHLAAYLVNLFWSLNNCLALSVIIRASMLRGEEA